MYCRKLYVCFLDNPAIIFQKLKPSTKNATISLSIYNSAHFLNFLQNHRGKSEYFHFGFEMTLNVRAHIKFTIENFKLLETARYEVIDRDDKTRKIYFRKCIKLWELKQSARMIAENTFCLKLMVSDPIILLLTPFHPIILFKITFDVNEMEDRVSSHNIHLQGFF